MTDVVSPPAPPRCFGVEWIVGVARAQRWMWAEAFSNWVRREPPSVHYAHQLGDGQHFESRRGAWMSVLVPMVVFAQFVDVLVLQGVIHVVAAGAHRVALHVLLLVVSLWAVALRSATRRVDHVLGSHALTLAIGFKQLCRIPLATIATVRAIDHRAVRGQGDWRDVHGLKPRDVTLLTPLDKPTLLIELQAGAAGAWWTRNGVRRPLRRWVAVYVDQPAAMAAAVIAHMAPSISPSP